MDEEQAAFEQLTFNDFKKWSFTALKTFNIYPILMQHMNIMSVVLLSLLLIFELIHQAALLNFMFFSIFKISKI